MMCVLKAALLGAPCLLLAGSFAAHAADLDAPCAQPPVPYAYERPVVIQRPVVVERPIVVEQPVIVERRFTPQPYFYPKPSLYPGSYFDTRRLSPPYYGPYRRFGYGPRPHGWYR